MRQGGIRESLVFESGGERNSFKYGLPSRAQGRRRVSMSKLWRLWAKALGEKATSCDKESDKVAWVRTVLILQSVVTNIFIIANAVRHWYG